MIFLFSSIYLCIQHLFISVSTYRYLFNALDYSSELFYYFYCSNYSSFDHWEPFYLHPAFLQHVSIIVCYCCHCCWTISYLLAKKNVASSPCIFLVPVLEWIIFPKRPDFLSLVWEAVIIEKSLVTLMY